MSKYLRLILADAADIAVRKHGSRDYTAITESQALNLIKKDRGWEVQFQPSANSCTLIPAHLGGLTVKIFEDF